MKWSWCGGLALAVLCSTARAENRSEVLELPQTEVVGTTALPGSAIELRKLPANAQVFTSRDLRRQRSANLTEFLEQNATGISVNAAQGNPYQPDVNLRGFSASPLLGTPQGVSVFFDGVRINEPFGDAVNWDLIAQSAISSIQLIPGSNPAFGLNTLGGAIALYSKSGASEFPDQPGGAITTSVGSFGRRALSFESGGKRQSWDWYVTGNDARDTGWADHNGSAVRQLFGKVGWQDDKSDLDLSIGGADNRLDGSQTLPQSFSDFRAAYTHPDRNTNRAGFVALKGSQAFSDALLLSGNAYLRRFDNVNLSSNVSADGSGGPAQATDDLSTIGQVSSGAGVQLTDTGSLGSTRHKASFGLSLDQGRARFTHTARRAVFTPDRGTVGVSDFAVVTDADTSTQYLGAYGSDSLDLDNRWTLTLAGRFNRAHVTIADRTGAASALNGSHRFTRFNPALGLNFNPSRALTAYASYNEGMRVPTAIELTCADPAAPCQLPNSFLADPPLNAVVSKTFEIGTRGNPEARTSWSVAIYRTDLLDDLQFVSSSGTATHAGYFRNVGNTRRQGLELDLASRSGPIALALHYSFVDATYRTAFDEHSPSNSAADAVGTITVTRGSRIPSIPRHSLKVRTEFSPNADWRIAANLQVASSVHARGDENNQDASGQVPGYAVVNLDGQFQAGTHLQFFLRINNLFDRRYANFGILGSNVFTGPGFGFDPANARAEQFRGHGAPRGAWIGMQYSFG